MITTHGYLSLTPPLALADADPLHAEPYTCGGCGVDTSTPDAEHFADCPYLRARAFVAREGREDR